MRVIDRISEHNGLTGRAGQRIVCALKHLCLIPEKVLKLKITDFYSFG
jgi:hypothetical protein